MNSDRIVIGKPDDHTTSRVHFWIERLGTIIYLEAKVVPEGTSQRLVSIDMSATPPELSLHKIANQPLIDALGLDETKILHLGSQVLG